MLKTTIITGRSKGIGKKIITDLVNKNHNIINLSRRYLNISNKNLDLQNKIKIKETMSDIDNILVCPCSTGIGIEIYDSLNKIKNIRLYGINFNKKSRGFYLYKNYNEFIKYTDDKFKSELSLYIKKNNINYIIPGDDNTVILLKELEKELNVKVITSPVETSKIARFKSKTYNILKDVVKTPQIYNLNHKINFPVFIKPDNGAGAVDSYLINNKKELDRKLKKNHIICEYLPGKEFTIECLTDKNRKLLCSIVRERTIISNGLSIGTKIIENEDLLEKLKVIAENINDKLIFTGSWFFQVKLDQNNELTLLEISTRLPGSSNIIRSLGINMILLSLYIHKNLDVKIKKLEFKNFETLKIYRNFYDVNFNKIDNLYLDFDDTIIINNKVNVDIINLIYKFINKNKKIYLITRHNGNLYEKLKFYKIPVFLFNEIYWIKDHSSKNSFIKNNSIFIDDSYQERNSISKNRNIWTFDINSLEILINNKNI